MPGKREAPGRVPRIRRRFRVASARRTASAPAPQRHGRRNDRGPAFEPFVPGRRKIGGSPAATHGRTIARIQSGASEKGAGNFRRLRPKRPRAEPAVPRSPRGGGFRAGARAGARGFRPPGGEAGRPEAGIVARWRSSGGAPGSRKPNLVCRDAWREIARQRGWQPIRSTAACRHAAHSFPSPPEFPGAQETELNYGKAPRPVPSNRRHSLSAVRQRLWRPGPDSNRRKRICSPLDRLSPTGPALPDDDIVRRLRTVNMALGRGVAPPIVGRPPGRGRPWFALPVRRQIGKGPADDRSREQETGYLVAAVPRRHGVRACSP